jgi:hypothetical protein
MPYRCGKLKSQATGRKCGGVVGLVHEIERLEIFDIRTT